MMCPVCGGSGKIDDGNYAYMTYHDNWYKCSYCGGRGSISITKYMQYVRDHRREGLD